MSAQYGLQDYLDAIRLAIEAAATQRAAMSIIGLILDGAPEGDGSATNPTKILVDAIRTADGDILVVGSDEVKLPHA